MSIDSTECYTPSTTLHQLVNYVLSTHQPSAPNDDDIPDCFGTASPRGPIYILVLVGVILFVIFLCIYFSKCRKMKSFKHATRRSTKASLHQLVMSNTSTDYFTDKVMSIKMRQWNLPCTGLPHPVFGSSRYFDLLLHLLFKV